MGGCALLPARGSPWLPGVSPVRTLCCRVMSLFFQCRAGPCLSLEKLYKRLWVLSFPGRSKNHFIAINSEGMSNCSGALVGGLVPEHGQRAQTSPHFLAGQTGAGFRCSYQRNRAGCPFLWPGKVMGCWQGFGAAPKGRWHHGMGGGERWHWGPRWGLGVYAAVPAGPGASPSRAG